MSKTPKPRPMRVSKREYAKRFDETFGVRTTPCVFCREEHAPLDTAICVRCQARLSIAVVSAKDPANEG